MMVCMFIDISLELQYAETVQNDETFVFAYVEFLLL